MKKTALTVLFLPILAFSQSNFSLDRVLHIGTSMEENIREIALCPNGDLVVTGYPAPDLSELQTSFPGRVITHGLFSSTPNVSRNGDVNQNTFVARISGDLTQLHWIAVVGGNDFDRGYGIAVDAAGDIYVAGQTASDDFPVTTGALDETNNGGQDLEINNHHGLKVDAMVFKLSSDGQNLLYSTYLGGGGNDGCRGGVALDAAGNIYLAGFTSLDFTNRFDKFGSMLANDDFLADAINSPNKLDLLSRDGGDYTAGFVVKLNPTFDRVLWARFVGSNSENIANPEEVVVGLQVSGNHVYFNGISRGTIPGTTEASVGNGADVMAGVLDASDGSILAIGELGSSNDDDAKRRGVLDSNDNFYICTQIRGNDFNGMSLSNASGNEIAGLVKMNFDASNGQMNVDWISVIDEPYFSSFHGPAIDRNDHIFVNGLIMGQLPASQLTNAIDGTYSNAGEDALFRVYDPSGNAIYSTYIGGNSDDKPRFIALDAFENPILGINSRSTNYPDVDPAFQFGNAGGKDIYLTRLVNNDCRIVAIKPVNTQSSCDPATNTYTQDLEVIFANPNGDLVINGQTFSNVSPWDTVTVTLTSDGQPVNITADFSNYASCNINLNGLFNAPPNCSSDTEAPTIPGGLTSNNVTSSSVDLSWNASTDNVAVTEYRIYRDGNLETTVTNLSTTITGLSPATTYNFTVSARDAVRNESSQSSAVNITTLTAADTEAPTVPSGLSASGVTLNTVDLSWNASTDNVAVTEYLIYRDGNLETTVSNLSVTITSLNPATSYNFAVSARDAAGNESGQSAPVSVVTLAPCSITDIQVSSEMCNTSGDAMNVSLIVTYENPPVTGQLIINGQAFSIISSPQEVTLTNLTVDGSGVDVSAHFSNQIDCSITVTDLFTTQCLTLGVSDEFKFNVFPNPGTDLLVVELNGHTGGTLHLFDSMGKEHYEKEVRGSLVQIDVSDLKNGIYFMKLVTSVEEVARRIVIMR